MHDTTSLMITVDLARNVKQQELFNQTMYSIAKKRAGQSDYNKYFFYGGAIRGGKTFCILTILTILCKMFPKSKWVVVRADMPALTQTTIPSIEKILISSPNWKWSRDKSNYFVKHSNGSKIIFKGENITSDHELNDFWPYRDWETDRKSTRLNSSHRSLSRMPSSA